LIPNYNGVCAISRLLVPSEPPLSLILEYFSEWKYYSISNKNNGMHFKNCPYYPCYASTFNQNVKIGMKVVNPFDVGWFFVSADANKFFSTKSFDIDNGKAINTPSHDTPNFSLFSSLNSPFQLNYQNRNISSSSLITDYTLSPPEAQKTPLLNHQIFVGDGQKKENLIKVESMNFLGELPNNYFTDPNSSFAIDRNILENKKIMNALMHIQEKSMFNIAKIALGHSSYVFFFLLYFFYITYLDH
jgi:hypothetical protein